MYTIHKELFIYTTFNICKRKHVFFIAENLTKHRYDLIKGLNILRKNGKIHSYWTDDGSILVKNITFNICKQKHVFIYEDSINKTR
jgi:hypothetical protein